MQRRVGVLLAITVLISIVLGACGTRTASEEDDKKAAIVEMADVGMIQRGDGAGFALEALLEFRIKGKMSGENLDGDDAVEAGVGGTIDLTHAASSQRRSDLIRPEFHTSS